MRPDPATPSVAAPAIRAVILIAALIVPPGADAALRAFPGASEEAEGIPYSHPSSIRYSSAEDLFYVADTGNQRVVLLRGDLTEEGIVALSAAGFAPYCALPVGDGSFWMSDLTKSGLYLVNARGDVTDTLRIGPGRTPGRITWGADGRLIMIDRARRAVLRIDPSQGVSDSLAVPTEGVLEDIAVLPDGGWIVVAATGTPFWMLSPRSTTASAAPARWTSWGSHGEKPDDSSFPCSVACNAKGEVWIVDAFRHELRLVSKDHRVVERLAPTGAGAPPLRFPIAVAVGRDGNPVVLERGVSRVQRIERIL